MSCQQIRTAAAIVSMILLKRKRERQAKKKVRNVWVRRWIEKRPEHGFHQKLFREIKEEDKASFFNFFRMGETEFHFLLELVKPEIIKQETNMRACISPSERLALTLRFLATGDSYHSLMFLFRIPVSMISSIIPECCRALYKCLKQDYLKVPDSVPEWLQISHSFQKEWNFPHCIGALDGKHIVMKAPPNSGSAYFNYKGTHSIVLMVLADANYKIIYFDAGCKRRVSDGGVFNNCALSRALETDKLQIPEPRALPGREENVPYVIVADDAFALKKYLLKPYPFKNQPAPNRVFNYRLSRARRIVENVFGIMANRFRVLRKPLELGPEKTVDIVSAICALHNFLMIRKESKKRYAPQGTFDLDNEGVILPGNWRNELALEGNCLPLQRNTHHSATGKEIRDEFRDFFISPEGEVAWQYKYI